MKKFLFIFLAIFALSTLSSQVIAGDDIKDKLLEAMSSGGKKAPAKTTKPTKPKRRSVSKDTNASDEQMAEFLTRLEEVEKRDRIKSISAAQVAARDIVIWYFVLTCIFGFFSVVASVLTLWRLPRAPEVIVLARRIKTLEDAAQPSQPQPPA